jgi:uncharacterized lipoprotein YehR (DUF1307 family)
MRMSARLSLAALTLFVAFALSACAEKPEKRLIGKWSMDTQAALASEKFTKMPEDQKEFAKKMIEEMGSKMIFEFQEGGKVHVEMGEMKEDGEWSVKSVEGDKMVIHSKGGKPDADGKQKEEDVTITFKGDRMIMNMKGEDMTFMKK